MVCKLLCMKLSEEVRKPLQFFMEYLAQCKIEFTPYGFTKINRGLLTTV